MHEDLVKFKAWADWLGNAKERYRILVDLLCKL